MTTLSANLAYALNELPFVQAIENEQQGQAISILCRIRAGAGAAWASLAERILREASKREGGPEYWHTHVARVYMIRDNRLVYGWVFVIQSANPEQVIPIVSELISQFATATAPASNGRPTPRRAPANDDYDEPEEIQEDNDYAEPEGRLAPGQVPESDEKGNPIVPREHRVHKQPMAGLPKNYDRNAPDPEKAKGSWSIESLKGKQFRPPVRR